MSQWRWRFKNCIGKPIQKGVSWRWLCMLTYPDNNIPQHSKNWYTKAVFNYQKTETTKNPLGPWDRPRKDNKYHRYHRRALWTRGCVETEHLSLVWKSTVLRKQHDWQTRFRSAGQSQCNRTEEKQGKMKEKEGDGEMCTLKRNNRVMGKWQQLQDGDYWPDWQSLLQFIKNHILDNCHTYVQVTEGNGVRSWLRGCRGERSEIAYKELNYLWNCCNKNGME